MLAFARGEGFPRPGALGTRGSLYLLLLAAGLAANLLAWRWEAQGATVALLALAGLVAVEMTMNHHLPGVWFFILLGIPALSFLLAWALGRWVATAGIP